MRSVLWDSPTAQIEWSIEFSWWFALFDILSRFFWQDLVELQVNFPLFSSWLGYQSVSNHSAVPWNPYDFPDLCLSNLTSSSWIVVIPGPRRAKVILHRLGIERHPDAPTARIHCL